MFVDFNGWLASQQHRRGDIGDLAREVANNKDYWPANADEQFEQRLSQASMFDDLLALRAAWEEFAEFLVSVNAPLKFFEPVQDAREFFAHRDFCDAELDRVYKVKTPA